MIAPPAMVRDGDNTSQTILINAAFLQEIKDSNPNLWLAASELRALCEAEHWDPDTTSQALIKQFVRALGELRDLIAFQFGLEESYGYLRTVGPTPQLANASPDFAEVQQQLQLALEQHQRLYLDLCDLVEQSEELQYRGCDRSAVVSFAEQVAHFTRQMTRHERLEAELIEREL
ncbi:hypothetical protein RISK_000755 [Rhodopirellula islandica]|uniref:Hemerythrin-like domain-containing protein n=1 Tax=Rhodopirellula islandica TaxID=595434 RepID=A0A0J1EN91_RHOIS|nr:hypothetical protein [Rhodopirellula islandica]KLU06954.1 hypothetical protein RISK_000755 [Rhodopirellula islandica]